MTFVAALRSLTSTSEAQAAACEFESGERSASRPASMSSQVLGT